MAGQMQILLERPLGRRVAAWQPPPRGRDGSADHANGQAGSVNSVILSVGTSRSFTR